MIASVAIRVSAVSLATIVGLGLGVVPAGAEGAGRQDLPAAAMNNPEVDLWVINQLPSVIRGDPSGKLDPSYVPGPIIYTDGTPVPGQSADMTNAAAACGGTVIGTAGGIWGPVSQGNCSVIGSPGATHRYNWQRALFVFTQGCVRARGFNSAGTAVWYSAGCGTSGGVTAPWGNILAMPATQAYSQAVVAGFTANWQG